MVTVKNLDTGKTLIDLKTKGAMKIPFADLIEQ